MKTRKALSLLLTIVMLFSTMSLMSVSAATEYTDGYYKYTVSGGKATITDVDAAISGDITVPATLGGYAVVKIADKAFMWCENITAVILPESLKAIGNNAFADCRNLKSVNIVGNTATTDTCALDTIGEYAFLRCWELSAMDIPDTVTTLKDGAFASCIKLADIKIGTGITVLNFCVFDGCIFTSIDIGDNVQRIESSAFNMCENLSTVYIGKEVNYIDADAFNNGNAIDEFIVSKYNDNFITVDGALYATADKADKAIRNPYRLIKLVNNALSGDAYVIPAKLYWIEPAALSGFEGLKFNASQSERNFYVQNSLLMHRNYNTNPVEITIVKYFGSDKVYTVPSGAASIQPLCFSGADFEKVIIPNGTTDLGYNTFYNCKNLKEVVLPSTLRTIGSSAFSKCTSLETINIPDKVSYLNYGLFGGCTNLKHIDLPNSLTGIDQYVFADTIIEELALPTTVASLKEYSLSHMAKLKKVTVRGTFTEIPAYIFYGCHSLETVEINEGVEVINNNAFESCNALKNIALPSSINEIEEYAFIYCWSLEKIVLPEGIEKISEGTFKNCGALAEITIPAGVIEIENDAFMNIDNLKYVYFGGTKSQWDAIAIGLNNDALRNATVIFSDGISCKHLVTEERAQVEATCKAAGKKAGVYCKDCNTYISGGEVIAVLPHNLSTWIVVTEPSCVAKGTDKRSCSACDYSETREISATGHNYQNAVCTKCGDDKSERCSCNCHNGNFFTKLIWKFLLFFYKIMGRNSVCECGVAHY